MTCRKASPLIRAAVRHTGCRFCQMQHDASSAKERDGMAEASCKRDEELTSHLYMYGQHCDGTLI
ncbi:MAG: hypothetical protein BHV84_06910 [Prevotella sp. AG:487_50_53]|nr:MAG: hypothetical protein BHV84_06910 [Prevotella sp. AG:487_50_53]